MLKSIKSVKVDSIIVVEGREWRIAGKYSNFITGSPNAHERSRRAHSKATHYILWLADDKTGDSMPSHRVPVDGKVEVKVVA